MNQFKPIFIGTLDPSSPLAGLKRAVNSQKCIRAGGKHNDLDDVGKDTYHHTFFEMLGTWSFGNYFKKEAIDWAYDILVNEYKLPKERLYASYFGGDEAMGLPCDTEARDFWLKYLPKERVLPFDKKANFWEMGDTGPCGPCSEIHFDRIGGRDAATLVNADDPDVIEIWNLVFIQYNREPSGELRQLPDKHIDTGMGLERLTSILQNKRSNYDTDVFMPIFDAIQKVVGCPPYTGKLGTEDAAQNYRDTAYRVVADHVRTLTFAITDGAVPSNEGRGYVLRRILRRAVRYGMQTLGAKPGFFSQLVPVVVKELGGAFPELKDKQKTVAAIITEEEEAFSSMLERGLKYFGEVVTEIQSKGIKKIEGPKAFYLYDTLGFPVDLTQLMAAEKGLEVDMPAFMESMEEQKSRSRAAGKSKRLEGRIQLSLQAEQTSFLQKSNILPTDYSSRYIWDQSVDSTIEAIYTSKGFVDKVDNEDFDTVGIIMKKSPFYAESGGQVSDTGLLEVSTISGTKLLLDVIDVQVYGGYVLHTCIPLEANSFSGLAKGSGIKASVNYERRRKVAPNHTMTHVLNYALRDILGNDVDQKGSQVSEEKLRFDFSYNKAVSIEDLAKIEKIVNNVIEAKLTVHNDVVPLKDAMAVNGLRAVFGETYPDPVRVISIGPAINNLLSNPNEDSWRQHSIEFCGGTHLSNTKDAEAFILTEETAVAKGIRRISGITGEDAKAAIKRAEELKVDINKLQTSMKQANTNVDALEGSVNSLRANLEEMLISQAVKSNLRSQLESIQKELGAVKNKMMMELVDKGIQGAKDEIIKIASSGKKAAILTMNIGSDSKAIKRAIEEIKKVASGVSFLGISTDNEKITIFSYVPDEAQGSIKANEWISCALEKCGGRGGGKPGMAQGSAAFDDSNKLTLAIKEANKYLESKSVVV